MVKRKTRSWIVDSEEVELDMDMFGIAGKIRQGILNMLKSPGAFFVYRIHTTSFASTMAAKR